MPMSMPMRNNCSLLKLPRRPNKIIEIFKFKQQLPIITFHSSEWNMLDQANSIRFDSSTKNSKSNLKRLMGRQRKLSPLLKSICCRYCFNRNEALWNKIFHWISNCRQTTDKITYVWWDLSVVSIEQGENHFGFYFFFFHWTIKADGR